MKSVTDISQDNLRLLSTVELDEVIQLIADIVQTLTGAKATAFLVWDHDLEAFSDRKIFGAPVKEFVKLVNSFADDNYEGADEDLCQLNVDEAQLPDELCPIVLYRIATEKYLYAFLLMAGVESFEQAELKASLNLYPLAKALENAWEFRELKRENDRLRDCYDELEASTRSLEEQTRKLIHDMMAKDALHTKKIERDRLVYGISNAVRSSLKIHEVLQIAVTQIGQSFAVSNCLLLRPVEHSEQLIVYEYHHPKQSPIKDFFCTDSGFKFMQTAVKHKALQDLTDPQTDSQNLYDKNFLIEIGLKSGLIVPLILRESVLGVIFLQERTTDREWSIDDTALLGSLADLVSVAIENAELHEEKERQARTDGLTGVANRRYFTETLYLEFERAKRYGQSLALIVADLDFLKKINDTYGHQVGDEAIKTIASVFHQSSRTIDLAARYGGEEFCLLLPQTDLEMAKQIADRLLRQLNETKVDGLGHISASFGVAGFPEHANDPESLFQRADEALYRAKANGRNCVFVFELNGGQK